MSTPKICNIEHKMIYAACAILMIAVLYFYIFGFTHYISGNMSAEKVGNAIISLSVFSSNLIVTFIPINNISRYKYMLIAGVFIIYIFGIYQYTIENNVYEIILIICLSIQFHFLLFIKNIGKIFNINNNVFIIVPTLIAIAIILLLTNDPNFEYHDPVLIISSSMISLMLINPKSTSNMNISNISYIIMKSIIIIIILTIIFTYVMADFTNYDRVEKSCMFSTTDCVNKTIAIAYMVLSSILLSPILVTYRGIKSK